MISSSPFLSPNSAQPGLAIVQVDGGTRWLRFSDPVAVVQTQRVEEVQSRLLEVANLVEGQRLQLCRRKVQALQRTHSRS